MSSETPRYINTGKEIIVWKMTPLTINKAPFQKRRRKKASQEIGGGGVIQSTSENKANHRKEPG
jgi:hypothetical protein